MILRLPFLVTKLRIHLYQDHGRKHAEVNAEEGEVVDVLDEGEEREDDSDDEAKSGASVLKTARSVGDGPKVGKGAETDSPGSAW